MRRAVAISCFLICMVAAVHSGLATAKGPAATVRVPFPRDEGILTPYSFELGYPFVMLMYDTLLWRDREGNPQPWLARSVKRSAGGRHLVLSLRRGVRWQDGRPLTAADVAFTFDFVKRHIHLRFTPELSGVLRVRAANRYTVTIDLRQPAPGFLDQPLADLPILPRHLWANRSADRPIPPGLPVGSGPYRMTSYLPGKGYRFVANPGYFRGRPRVDRIQVDIMRGGRRTLDALERGKVDVVPTGLPLANGRPAREQLAAPGSPKCQLHRHGAHPQPPRRAVRPRSSPPGRGSGARCRPDRRRGRARAREPGLPAPGLPLGP